MRVAGRSSSGRGGAAGEECAGCLVPRTVTGWGTAIVLPLWTASEETSCDDASPARALDVAC